MRESTASTSTASVFSLEDPHLNPKRERSKSRDAGKRMGGGQKGIWCDKTSVPVPLHAMDPKDPNFDSETDENIIFVSEKEESNPTSLHRRESVTLVPPDALAAKELSFNPPLNVKKDIIHILDEYFVSGDLDDAREQLREKIPDEFKYDFVKRAMSIAMDKNDKEREMTSRLLSELYLNGLTPTQIQAGFRRVLLIAGDLEIDIPTARQMLAIFCARAVVDEIVPPRFMEDSYLVRYAPDIASAAIKKLSIHHGLARMEKGWGPGDGRPVEELKISIDQLTKEYISSRDLQEAARCVRELNVPHFHHELIKRGITNAMEEGGEENIRAMASLFAFLVTQDIVPSSQLVQGYERFYQTLNDVILDIPNARKEFENMVTIGICDGILPRNFMQSSA